MAIDDISGHHPGFKFTVEYTIFMKHFLQVYPEYLPKVKKLIKGGKLEVCPIMAGAIEQFTDGEILIHQLVQAKRWIRETLNKDPITVQQTDLPGHVTQIAQFLNGVGVKNLAYSRYHAPVPLHRYKSPDGSEVTACCHFHHDYETPTEWEGYGWGWQLFVNNTDMDIVYKSLPEDLKYREKVWPEGVNAILMGCESDLQPGEPEMLTRIGEWNKKFPKWPVIISTPSQFFAEVDKEKLPVYGGEMPYGFFSLPSIYIPCAQEMRRGENVLAAAGKWSTFKEMAAMGRFQIDRFNRAKDYFFLPHDHNTGGRRGEINDLERYKDALSARLEGESMLQEAAMTFTVNIDYKGKGQDIYPITVFNSMSWNRSDIVETYIEVPMAGVRSLNIVDSKGKKIPSQILKTDDNIKYEVSRIYLVFVANNVPAHGYETYYVRPSKKAEKIPNIFKLTKTGIKNRFFDIRLRENIIRSIRWNGKELVGGGKRRFNEIFALEDRTSNVGGGPWEIEKNYTGKKWGSKMGKMEVIESGPIRAIVRFHGKIFNRPFSQDLIIYDSLERIDLRHSIDYKMRMHTQTRVAYPFNVPQGKATYESTYGTVRLEKDEMANTFRGHGERWVGKWIDISNRDFGVSLATKQISHAISNDGIEPLLVRSAIDCGTIFYYFDQDETYTLDYSLIPHRYDWKRAAAHRAGWDFNNPLYSCNMTTCFPIKPIRSSRNLAQRDSYFQVNDKNVVITAIQKSQDDSDAFIIRIVDFYGRAKNVTLKCKLKVRNADEVNLLEEKISKLAVSGNQIKIKMKKYGIHTIKIKFRR